MKPGRELDTLVAEKVFDYESCGEANYSQLMGSKGIYRDKTVYVRSKEIEFQLEEVRPHSTGIAAAWEVVEHFGSGYWISIYRTTDVWTVEFEDVSAKKDYFGISKSLPHAICLAALKAKGVEV